MSFVPGAHFFADSLFFFFGFGGIYAGSVFFGLFVEGAGFFLVFFGEGFRLVIPVGEGATVRRICPENFSGVVVALEMETSLFSRERDVIVVFSDIEIDIEVVVFSDADAGRSRDFRGVVLIQIINIRGS